MYPFSPDLPSHPGRHITLSRVPCECKPSASHSVSFHFTTLPPATHFLVIGWKLASHYLKSIIFSYSGVYTMVYFRFKYLNVAETLKRYLCSFRFRQCADFSSVMESDIPSSRSQCKSVCQGKISENI